MSANFFKQPIDDRLSSWANFRSELENSQTPFEDVWTFWKDCPFIPYNHKIDPYHQKSWPSPWEIIVDNRYDDFTKALMIAWTLKLTKRFQNSRIEIKTMIDKDHKSQYTIVYVDDEWVINYNDNGPTEAKDVPSSFLLENQVELVTPR